MMNLTDYERGVPVHRRNRTSLASGSQFHKRHNIEAIVPYKLHCLLPGPPLPPLCPSAPAWLSQKISHAFYVLFHFLVLSVYHTLARANSQIFLVPVLVWLSLLVQKHERS